MQNKKWLGAGDIDRYWQIFAQRKAIIILEIAQHLRSIKTILKPH